MPEAGKYYKDKLTGKFKQVVVEPSWTPEEWAAKIKGMEDKIAQIQGQLDSTPKPKTKPDKETLDFYNSQIMMFSDQGLQDQIDQIKKELHEMLAA